MADIFHKVNRYGVLKVPPGLWAIIGFQARHWIILAFVMASARRSPEAVRLVGDGLPYLQLTLELPILLLFIAALNRQPQAGRFTRSVWRVGRQLITFAAGLNLAWVTWYVVSAQYWHPWPDNFVVLGGFVDLLIIAATWASAYYRELFSEFPAMPSSSRERTSS